MKEKTEKLQGIIEDMFPDCKFMIIIKKDTDINSIIGIHPLEGLEISNYTVKKAMLSYLKQLLHDKKYDILAKELKSCKNFIDVPDYIIKEVEYFAKENIVKGDFINYNDINLN